ncbi:MAG TPA: ATP synthase F1 subunit gamma [Ruminococcaceae bacterium]|nr:ATP synthase F1 subunit gamma [Oscillospiraceae bacterium]
MANMKELRVRIHSVRETKKITNAMYRISSAKVRRARADLAKTRPYFRALSTEIKRIFRTVGKSDSRYFYPNAEEPPLDGTYGYLVITSDRGLAGAYNQNVLKEAQRLMKEHPDCLLFPVGDYGKRFFLTHHIPVEQSFLYAAQAPTFDRAREIAARLLEYFDDHKIQKLFIVYTDLEGGMSTRVRTVRLLPLHHEQFAGEGEKAVKTPFEFLPSVNFVLENIVPGYVAGFIYSAIVDSFCCEHNARMEAMDSANRNAEKILAQLQAAYNHERQNLITGEITEISASAKYHKANKEAQEHEDDGENCEDHRIGG